MYNPHPPLSGFPFTLTTIAVVITIIAPFTNNSISLRNFGGKIFLLACIITPITYFSGYWGLDHAEKSFKISAELIEEHQNVAQLSLFFYIITLLFYFLSMALPEKKLISTLYTLLLLLTFGCTALTSFKGGELVFTHGAGVSAERGAGVSAERGAGVSAERGAGVSTRQ